MDASIRRSRGNAGRLLVSTARLHRLQSRKQKSRKTDKQENLTSASGHSNSDCLKDGVMKIIDLLVVPFRVPSRHFRNGELLPVAETVQTVTKIVTDEGAEGYYFGGSGHGDMTGLRSHDRAALEGRIKSLIVGHDPFDREKFWHWLWVANIPEHIISVLDMVLWDLQARMFGVPVYKLLGGCRDKVKAYASTYPNRPQ